MPPRVNTRSMAPGKSTLRGRFVTTKTTPEVQSTWDKTFKNQISQLDLDGGDPILRATKRQRRDSSFDSAISLSSRRDSEHFVEIESNAGRMFKQFPIEVHQLIAKNLSTDQDISNFSKVCPRTQAAIDPRFWRKFFIKAYDIPVDYDANKDKDGEKLFAKYKVRQMVFNTFTVFDVNKYSGRMDRALRIKQQGQQEGALQVLRTLILEMNAKKPEVSGHSLDAFKSNTLKTLCNVIIDNGKACYLDIIDSILSTQHGFEFADIGSSDKKNTLEFVVQLSLTPLSLRPDICLERVSHFDLSQAQAYATSATQPIFTGKWRQNINALWLLYTVNFFKFHLKSPGEGIMAHAYQDLEADQYPQPWTGVLQAGTQPLNKFWKGVHTFMPILDLYNIRTDPMNGEIYSDALDSADIFQDMEIFDDQPASTIWPDSCEEALQSDPFVNPSGPVIDKSTNGKRSTRSSLRKSKANPLKAPNKPEIKTFYGVARDTKTAYFFGRVHALPQQQGIHGFQRLVAKKFYLDENGDMNPNEVYHYEGCVFPGGGIIVGRWYNHLQDVADDNAMSGPFLWWSVDRSAREPSDKNEILEFAENFHF